VAELAKVLEPVLPADFFRDHWNRRALHIPGPPEKFAALYDAETWTRFEGIDDLKAVTTDARGVQVEIPALAAQAGALFLNGFTICANVTEAPRVASFLSTFRADLPVPGGPPFAKLYASNDGRGFAVHADKHHVFVLQIAGQKQWRYSRVPVAPAPIDGLFLGPDGLPSWRNGHGAEQARLDDGAPIAPPDVASFDAALLEPGHCLYLPPGTWHVARAVGHSIAVSVSPECATVTDFFVAAVRELFAHDPAWRQELSGSPADDPVAGAIPAGIAGVLGARAAELRAAIDHLDERRLHRLWQLGVATAQSPTIPPKSWPASHEIHRADLLARADAGPFHFLVAPSPGGDEERCYFYRAGEWSLPAAAREVLTKLSAHDAFRAEEALAWDRRLKFQELREILATLVAAGVLERR
jgi:hypothetical protein